MKKEEERLQPVVVLSGEGYPEDPVAEAKLQALRLFDSLTWSFELAMVPGPDTLQ